MDAPKDFQWYDDIAIGQDFGYNHADAIYIYGIKDGNIYVISGIYEHEKDTAELIEIANQRGIPKTVTMWCDSAEPDRITTWRKAGYRAKAVKKEQNSIKAQIDYLKGNPDSDHPIRRMIYIDSSCTNFQKEIGQWKWKYDEKRDEYLDEPVSFFDDAMASLRYGIEGWRKPRMIQMNTFK